MAFRTATGKDRRGGLSLNSAVAAPKSTSTTPRPRRTSPPAPADDLGRSQQHVVQDYREVRRRRHGAFTSSTPGRIAIARLPAGGEHRAGPRCSRATPPPGTTSGRSDIVVSGRPELQEWIRSNLYALQSSIRAGDDNSIAPGRPEQRQLRRARSSGTRRRGCTRACSPSIPDVARVDHRVPPEDHPRRARQRAQATGYQGLFFPWNGAGTGDLGRSATAGIRRTA